MYKTLQPSLAEFLFCYFELGRSSYDTYKIFRMDLNENGIDEILLIEIKVDFLKIYLFRHTDSGKTNIIKKNKERNL